MKSPLTNPHKNLGKTLALVCFFLAGAILFAGVFFVIAAATVEVSQLPLGNLTNQQLVGLTAFMFLILALLFFLTGRHLWRLWGKEQLQEKAGAKTALGCLLISSLGCGLWAILSSAVTLLSGFMLMTGIPASLQDVLVGASGFVLAVIVMLIIAGYLWRFHVRPQPAEQEHAKAAYLADLRQQMTQMPEPLYKMYAQAQTLLLLERVDAPHKREVIKFLYDAGLLRRDEAIHLAGANLKQVDLHGLDLAYLNLQGANLQGANLQSANLRGANFHKANLRRANLNHSHFFQANFWKADLRQANLTGADFTQANLTDAKVTQAQLKVVGSSAQAIMPNGLR